MATLRYHRYWGKTSKEATLRFHLLVYHCLDVAAVGHACLRHGSMRTLFRTGDATFDRDGLPRWLAFFLALHDLGKFASSFQAKRPDVCERMGRPAAQKTGSCRHDILGSIFWKQAFSTQLKTMGASAPSALCDVDWRDLKPLTLAVFGHHGMPPESGERIIFREHFTEADRSAGFDFITDAFALFGLDRYPWPDLEERPIKLLSWPLAGLAVLSDWIGSDEANFPLVEQAMSLDAYFNGHAVPNAARAIEQCGVAAPPPSAWTGFTGLFPGITSPSPLQAFVSGMELGGGPSLHILEDVTGSGKTEAALSLAHRIMDAGNAHALYLGLPTMATASAMYSRMRGSYRRLFGDDASPSLALAHASRDMDRDFQRSVRIGDGRAVPETDEPDSRASCAAWLADNRKKSLLAAVGVGTLDQALLAAMHARHQSLRLFGLGRSVLIADEVHAYDAYTTKLLEALLQFQAALGGSAILLSATLPRRIKRKLANAFVLGIGLHRPELASADYPLATSLWADGRVRETHIASRPDVSRWTRVSRLASPDAAIEEASRAADAGACVLYVRNCVDDAVEAYRALESNCPGRAHLFHARFTLGDRQEIEKIILKRFGKDSTPEERQGRIVVATQVAEQSLDVDFDLVISDLAPMESLLQRAGRCCRHGWRTRPDGYETSHLMVVSPEPELDVRADWYKAMFPTGAFVYPGHGRLWLTARRLFERGGFDLSREGRDLMEYVYGEDSPKGAPGALAKSDQEYEGGKYADESFAWDKTLRVGEGYCQDGGNWEDDEGVFTRLGQKTSTLCLCRLEGGRVVPWAGSGGDALDWRLSEVRVRQARLKSGDVPSEAGAAEALTETVAAMPGGGKWVTPVLLTPAANEPDMWRFRGLDGQARPVSARYSKTRGLEWG